MMMHGCHSREGGNPVVGGIALCLLPGPLPVPLLDSRLRGNDGAFVIVWVILSS